MTRLIDELNVLHDHYVEAINLAVAEDDHPRAAELAAGYDHEAVVLMAAREGREDLLPFFEQRAAASQRPDTPLHRLARRFTERRAA